MANSSRQQQAKKKWLKVTEVKDRLLTVAIYGMGKEMSSEEFARCVQKKNLAEMTDADFHNEFHPLCHNEKREYDARSAC